MADFVRTILRDPEGKQPPLTTPTANQGSLPRETDSAPEGIAAESDEGEDENTLMPPVVPEEEMVDAALDISSSLEDKGKGEEVDTEPGTAQEGGPGEAAHGGEAVLSAPIEQNVGCALWVKTSIDKDVYEDAEPLRVTVGFGSAYEALLVDTITAEIVQTVYAEKEDMQVCAVLCSLFLSLSYLVAVFRMFAASAELKHLG